MATTTQNATIAGSDNTIPIADTTGRWTEWALAQLFMGVNTPGAQADGATPRFIGKVNDYVVDYTTDERWIITAIDPTSFAPTLRKISAVIDGSADTTDLLMIPNTGGTYAETYRAFFDDSVFPYKLTVDKRATINSVLTKYAKIWQGSKLLGTDKVVSAMYDASGQYLGENVTLELIAMPNTQNYAVKAVSACYSRTKLTEGDALTVVFYDDEGGVVSTRQVMVVESAFMRATDASAKYVTGITLDSPWISSSNPNELQYPINLPLDGLNLFGIVHYSDGTTLRMPVDGTKFQLRGFKQYVATIVGQPVPLQLQYNFSDNEIAYRAESATPDGQRFTVETYQAITTSEDGAYSLKLFCSPTWNTDVNQWRLRWFLYSLDRDISIDVSPYVTFASNADPFNPAVANYGINQQLQVSLDLSKVNGVYRKVIHTQTVGLVLYRGATDHSGTMFTVYYDPSQNPPYGVGLTAKVTFVNQNLKYVDISQGLSDETAWLNAVLAPAKPLYDTRKEPTYPTPTHFAFLWTDGTQTEFPITQFTSANEVSAVMADGDTVNVKFFQRTPEADIQIAMCPINAQFLT